MTVEIESKFEQRIREANVIWLTTVRADGMPQPTPVWFIHENGIFTIYTMPGSQKVKNIAANPKVALNLDSEREGEHYVVIMGEATLDSAPPPATDVPAYISKYRQGITDINMTPESFVQMFSAAIRVTPTRARGE